MTEPVNTGGMVALVPSDSSLVQLAVPGGDPATELHLTLAYLGDDVTDWTDEQAQAVLDIAHAAVDYQFQQSAAVAQGDEVPASATVGPYYGPGQQGPLSGNVFAHALFNPNATEDAPGPDEPATVYMLDGTADRNRMESLASDICWSVRDALGSIEFPQQHRPWVPHVTAGYGLPVDALTYSGPVEFDRIRVALGGTVTDYPMVGNTPEGTVITASGENEGALSPDAVAQHGGLPVRFPVVIVEGMETGDHRYITPGALGHRALPLPILAMNKTSQGGHEGAEVIGKLTELTRQPGPEVINKETGEPFPEGTFVWSGRGEVDPDAHATGLAQKGYLTGNSADLSDMDAAYEFDEGADGGEPTERLNVMGGKIAATTLVPVPAFAEAYIEFEDGPVGPAAELATVAASAAWTSSELGDECLPCRFATEQTFDAEGYAAGAAPDAAKRARALKKGLAMPPAKGKPAGAASYPVENQADLDKAIKAVGRGGADHDAIRKHLIAVAKKLKLTGIPANWNPDGSLKAVAASGAPELPALSDFLDPELTGPTAVTVTDDGRVYGHLATWGTCHIGFAGQCVTPPTSASDYAYFATKATRAVDSDGTICTVAVGLITIDTGHAPTSLAAQPAAAHYDNTGAAAAEIAVGEDAHGIWVAGRAIPGLSPEQFASLRRGALSGDWRKINNRLELVAALGVNVGGFPVPRARVASGEQYALVAAGIVTPETDEKLDPSGAIMLDYDQLANRIAERLNRMGVAAEGGPADVPLADQRSAALTELGLDNESRRLAAQHELALAELEARPF